MPEPWILWPEDEGTLAEFGGKAGALRELALAALPVPPWFAIPPGAWTHCRAFASSDESVEPTAALAAAWQEAASRILGEGDLLAVRSSAVDEDGAVNSFAGQLDSFLAVRPAEIAKRVGAVWRSAFSARARAYRHERNLAVARPPAVLVQRLVEASAAGVAFSADPVSGRWGTTVVSAVVGLGTRLVGGAGEADTWRVGRSGVITERTIVAKTAAHRPSPGQGEGVAEAVLEHPGEPALNDHQVRAVAALAVRCASARGAPQDIEWAFAGGELHLLQSRPITGLGRIADPDGRPALWDNSNIAESYGGVTSPLTYSFARRAYEEVYRQFCRFLGVSEARIAMNADTFRGMIGLVRGRVYYDLLNWHRVLELLPGYRSNRAFMEQMMGVKEGLPPEFAAVLELERPAPASWWGRRADALALGKSLLGLVACQLTIAGRIRRFYVRLDQALARPPVPLERQRPDELVASYRALEARLLTRWDAPLANDFLAMIFYGVLRAMCRAWCADAAGTLQNDLVGGEGGVISAEPADRVRALAALARGDPELALALRERPLARILVLARARPAFWAGYQGYLERFSDRCLEELKLESATLEDDPLPLLRAIGHLAARDAVMGDHASARRRDAEARAARALRWHPLRRLLLGFALRNARARVRDRENLRFERTRLFGRVRRILVELGRRLSAAGVLEDPRDVFHLELEEVLGFVSGTASCDDLRALSAARAAAFARYRSAPPPADRFATRGWVPVGNAFVAPPGPAAAGAAEVRHGLGACPGTVRGPARVVRDPRGAEVRPGSILVAERTDPGWIMLFPAASGLVVERGSLLSHSAIVARELGLPAVVGVQDATTWIADGDLIEIDGQSGAVRKLTSSNAAAASPLAEPSP